MMLLYGIVISIVTSLANIWLYRLNDSLSIMFVSNYGDFNSKETSPVMQVKRMVIVMQTVERIDYHSKESLHGPISSFAYVIPATMTAFGDCLVTVSLLIKNDTATQRRLLRQAQRKATIHSALHR